MKDKSGKNRLCTGAAPRAITVPAITLLEMVIAMAIITIIFAAVVPQFRVINNSWASKQGNAEVLQNGRVLIDHINRNLSKAVKITAVSDSTETNGFIEFEDNDGNNLRYDIADNNYVEFGPAGDLSDLAGPVSSLQFTCYDSNDFMNPTTDVNSIRLVEVQTTLPNSATLGQDKTFTTSVYLRTNWNLSSSGLVGWWKLDETSGTTAADSSGNGNDGTLINMGSYKWTTGILGGALEFDGFNDYVSLPIGSVINSLTNCTITTWVNWPGWGNDWQRCWDFGNDTSAYMFLTVNNSSTGTPRFAITTIGWWDEDRTTAPDVLPSGWHHITVTIDADNSVHSFYIDGNLVDENTSPRYTPSDLGNTTRNRLGRSQYSADPYFDGILDDVRIYDRVLEPEEIAQMADILTYRAFAEAKAASDVTSLTISTPDSNEGDLLVAAVATDGDTSASMAPPTGEGWTEIDIDDYSGEVTLGAWWKLADASESSSHQFTWSGAEQAYGWMMRFTGHDPDEPVNVYSVDGESSSTPTSPEVITTVNDCLIVRLGAFDDDDITVDDPGLSGHKVITMDKSADSTSIPVGWWKLDEISGTNAADSSGNGNDGTLYGPFWTTGQIGGALDFDGWNDYVSLPIGSVINSLTNCTIATWVNWSWDSSWQRIWDFGTGTTYYMFLTPRNSYNNRLRFAITRTGWSGEEQTTAPAVLPNGWHHVTVTIDAGNHTHKLYLDGSPVAQNTSGYLDPSDLGNTNQNWLGRSQYSADPYFDGRLDDVRIYNFTLSPEEVAVLAQWSGGSNDTVSGGAGCVKQSSSGDSGTSDFSLISSNEAQLLTIAIAPNSASASYGGGIRP